MEEEKEFPPEYLPVSSDERDILVLTVHEFIGVNIPEVKCAFFLTYSGIQRKKEQSYIQTSQWLHKAKHQS